MTCRLNLGSGKQQNHSIRMSFGQSDLKTSLIPSDLILSTPISLTFFLLTSHNCDTIKQIHPFFFSHEMCSPHELAPNFNSSLFFPFECTKHFSIKACASLSTFSSFPFHFLCTLPYPLPTCFQPTIHHQQLG